jgi:broad specificity phosphatase PhoE
MLRGGERIPGQARRVHLLRHALPLPVPQLPPSQWPLSPDSRSAARAMSRKVPGNVVLLSSTEQKAIETARLATGDAPICDARLREVDRPGESFDEFSSDRRGAWIRGELDERHQGWEAARQAGCRFARAVEAYPGSDLLIATHGMVLVAWLQEIGRLQPGEAAEAYWSALAFPQLITVEIPA